MNFYWSHAIPLQIRYLLPGSIAYNKILVLFFKIISIHKVQLSYQTFESLKPSRSGDVSLLELLFDQKYDFHPQNTHTSCVAV